MKNSVFLVFAFFVVMSCKPMPVDATPPPPPPQPSPAVVTPVVVDNFAASADRGVLMKNGTMMTIQNGESVPMSNDMTLENGDKVMMNGDVIHKDGSKTKMQEGTMINQNGTMTDKSVKKVDTSK